MDIHYDPNYWTNPNEFNPDRFYDKTNNKCVPRERLIPFSIGKRFCLGQSLAEKEYFLFFAGLIQKFEFLPLPGEPLPDIGKDSGITVGTIRGPPIYTCILKPHE